MVTPKATERRGDERAATARDHDQREETATSLAVEEEEDDGAVQAPSLELRAATACSHLRRAALGGALLRGDGARASAPKDGGGHPVQQTAKLLGSEPEHARRRETAVTVALYNDIERHNPKETKPSKKHSKVAEQKPLPDSHLSCILEFDAACHGNPGKSGAGVIVRRPDGSVIARLREGLGIATYNVAVYRALLLGLRYAATKGFKYIRAQGNCELVCNQAGGLWIPKSDNMDDLCMEVKQLKGRFLQFQVNLVLKEFNAEADAQAYIALKLPVGGIQEKTNFSC